MTLAEYDALFQTLPRKRILLQFSDGTFITNDKIVSESLELEENLCSDMNLRYGGCEASEFRIRVVNQNASYKDLWVDVIIMIVDDEGVYISDDNDEYITDENNYYGYEQYVHYKLGRYKVFSDKPTNDRVYRDLVCYDAMYDLINVDIASWYNGLTFPMTLKNYRDSLFTFLGFTQKTQTLVNDNYSVKGGYTTTELSSRDILQNICELNGVFGHINSDNEFEYISLPSSDTITLEWYQGGSGAYEDYVTAKITGIISYSADGNIGKQVGTTQNLYTIDNNLLMYGDEGTTAQENALNTLLNRIKNFQYRPFSVKTYGNPTLPLGTGIVVNTSYQTINSFIMSRYLKGIQGMTDTYRSYGDEKYPVEVNQVKTLIKRTDGKVASIKTDVDKIESTVGDWQGGDSISSTITQLSDEVVLKVDSNGKIVKVKLNATPSGSAFSISADNISFISNGKIQLTSSSLEINSTKFQVTSAGAVTCSDMTITGGSLNINNVFKVATDGKITSTGGTIGGFTIDTSKLYSGMTSLSDTTHDGVYIGTDGIALGKGNFKVSNSGSLTAKSGTIAGWNITTNAFYNGMTSLTDTTHDGVWLGTDGIALGKGVFKVTNAGSLTAKSGTIGGYTINSSALYNNVTSLTDTSHSGVYLGQTGLRVYQVNSGTTNTYTNVTGSGIETTTITITNSTGAARVVLDANANGSSTRLKNLIVSGTKTREVTTKDYGDRLLYCYETPDPTFGDIGEGIIAEDGKCYIWLDSVFAQTINTNGYQVFLQKYGQGECYVTERKANYFVVEGDVGMRFGWEIKAKQRDYEMTRLGQFVETPTIQTDYGEQAISHFNEITNEREVA